VLRAGAFRSNADPVIPAVLILVANTSDAEASAFGRENELSAPPNPRRPLIRRKSNLRMTRKIGKPLPQAFNS